MSSVDSAWEITVEEVKQMLDRKDDFLLLDVRQPEEYATAKIEEATFIPLGDLPAALPRLQQHADKPIITHCHLGMRSLQAAAFLRQQGFEQVRSMAGGIDAWAERIDQSVPRY